MTTAEREILLDLANVYNKLAALPDKHPADMNEAVFFVHGLQRIIMARIARRAYPDFFTQTICQEKKGEWWVKEPVQVNQELL
jgi:hypothetical protein